MHPLRKLALCFLALVSFPAVSSVAQNSVSRAQIVEKPNENQVITLKGNTPPAAIAANDRGRVSANMPMSGLVLVLRRSPEQQAAFDAFVARQYDANSPDYHHWLEPAEVGEQYGPALADIATISSWLGSHGLSVDEVAKDRMTIRFSGTAGQVEEAFHTEIHNLLVKGVPHISNMTDPQIPMALEPVVLGPKALHNFIPRPLHRLGGQVALNRESGKWVGKTAADAAGGGVRPEIGFSCGAGCLIEDVAPYDFATIYNVLPLWNAASPIDGTGQTIAIAGRSDVRAADVTAFRSTFGLKGGAFNIIHNLETGTVDPGYCTGTTGNCTLDDQIENALDVEWSGAIAKGATIDLVVTQQTNSNDSIYDSAAYAISNKVAPILNVSYGQCELFEGTSGNSAYNSLWQTAAGVGIAVFVASGDSGSPSCDQGAASSGPYGAVYGLSVSGLASSQYDTAVGGTDLNWGGTTAAPYWSSTNNSTNGATAVGYIPEVPWNDTCTNPIEDGYINKDLSTNYLAVQICYFIASKQITSSTDEQGALDLVNTIGGGGGASNCTTNGTTSTTTTPNPATCSGGYAEPSWQQAVFSGTGSQRMIPDVSFFAGNGFLGSAYLVCVSDWGPCVTSASTTTEPAVGEIGGTSAASPAMAGVMALINQKAGSAQGNPNSELYTLAGKQSYASCSTETVKNSSSCYFNDIDTGTNDMPCAAGSPDCDVPQTSYTVGVFNFFDAGVGYDMATGLGSLNVANVVNAWPAVVTGTATAAVAISAVPSTFTSAQGTLVTVTVTGASGTPTGTVVLSSGTFASTTKTLSSGSITFSLSPGVLPVGTDSIKASYSGDSVYAAATGTTQVTITQVTYSLVAGASSPATIAPGGSSTSTITASSTNGYVGAITLTCALTSSPAGASDLPTCAAGGSAVNLTSTTTSGTGTVSVSTTAATTSMKKPPIGGWAEAGSGAVLALLVFFGIPARRRGWRAMLGTLVLLATLGSLAACGGGGSSGGGGGGGNPGTTAGSYTFTVTGTGNDAAKTSETTTFTVTVN